MLFPVISLVIFLLLHWATCFFLRNKGLAATIASSAAAFVITYAFLQTNLPYAVATHAFLLMLYLHFLVGVDRSVSLRILHELLQANGLTLEQLNQVYPHEEMFAHRIRHMVNKGWIRETNGQLFATSKGQLLVQPTILLRKVYDLKSTW